MPGWVEGASEWKRSMHTGAGFLVVGAATPLSRPASLQQLRVSKAEAKGKQADASSDLALVLCFNTPDYVSVATLRPGTEAAGGLWA